MQDAPSAATGHAFAEHPNPFSSTATPAFVIRKVITSGRQRDFRDAALDLGYSLQDSLGGILATLE
jgi:hypothetical protein